MHIVLANRWFPPESGWGGVAMYNYTLAPAYRALGHQVSVVSSRLEASVPPLQEKDGIRVFRLLVRDVYRLRRIPVLGRYVRPLHMLAYSLRVKQAIDRANDHQPVDIVEFAEVNAEGFFYARAPRTPIVVRCHTPAFVLNRYYAPREQPADSRITACCEKDVIRRANALTAPSHSMAQVIAKECGLPEEKFHVIPNALCVGQFSPSLDPIGKRPADPITVLHVGRLDRVKGVTVLAQAIPRIIRQFSEVGFVFVGDDRPTARRTSQRAELEAQLTEAGVRSSVQFLGAVDQASLIEWYRRADICVAPSMLYESFSYTCAQAMAAGKPVVSTRIGGIPETVDDGANGLLVEPGDVGQLVDAIVHLARDAGMRKRFGMAGRDKAAREYDAVKVARQNLQVYERELARFKTHPGPRYAHTRLHV